MNLFYKEHGFPIWVMDFRFQSFILMLFCATCSLLLIDVTPVSAGQGWDGVTYYQLILDWSSGNLGRAENVPYTLMRSGAFLPQIFFYGITGEPPTHLISISRFIAVTFATLGGWFAVLACYRLGKINAASQKIAALFLFSCYLFSTAVFILPPHCPIATDHPALFISGLSLWLWSLPEQKYSLVKGLSLGLLAAWGIFVMPFISVIPMVLLMFPVSTKYPQKNILNFLLYKNTYFYFLLGLGLISLGIAGCFIKFVSLELPNEILLGRLHGFVASLIELKIYTAILSTIIIAWALLLFFTCGLRFLFNLSWFRFILAIATIIPSLLVLYIVPDWSQGIAGPSFILNLSIQSLQAPAAQIPSLFAYLGPLGLLGATALTLIILSRQSKELNAPALIAAFLFLFLSIGTETRQYIAIFPILLFISISVFKNRLMICFISLIFTIFLLSMGWPIADHVAQAMNANVDFMDERWQAAFGKVGPWMSPWSYFIYFVVTIGYLFVLFISSNFKNFLKKPVNNDQ
jgi:hypothetical protein